MTQDKAHPARNGRARPAPPPPAPDDDPADDEEEEEPVALAASIRPGRVSWLLSGLLPFGHVAVLEGRKEAGKSCLAAAVAAAVTGGPALPGCRRRAPAPCVWLAGEEHVPSITRPKLEAAGADLRRVYLPGWDTRGRLSRAWCLPGDLSRLERCLAGCHARLCVLDPVTSYVAPHLDLRGSQEMRLLVEDLARLAARCDALVLLLRNVRKGTSGHLLDMGLGSSEIGNVARAVLRVDLLDEPPGRRVLRRVAGNLAAPVRPLAFDLVDKAGQPAVAWQGYLDPNDPRLTEEDDDPAERDAFNDARRFLAAALSQGPRPCKDLQRQAEDAAISRATLRRAKKHDRIESMAKGARAERVWYWRLPRS